MSTWILFMITWYLYTGDVLSSSFMLYICAVDYFIPNSDYSILFTPGGSFDPDFFSSNDNKGVSEMYEMLVDSGSEEDSKRFLKEVHDIKSDFLDAVAEDPAIQSNVKKAMVGGLYKSKYLQVASVSVAMLLYNYGHPGDFSSF